MFKRTLLAIGLLAAVATAQAVIAPANESDNRFGNIVEAPVQNNFGNIVEAPKPADVSPVAWWPDRYGNVT